ncbi:MAG: mannose-1-phosphate guanylyltransferase, partial [Candidatus Eremiobacterota bacterium]
MSQLEVVCAIMAGGAGTRFWPVSTEQKPKQFLPLVGSRTLLQASFDRVRPLCGPERTLVLTNERYVDEVRGQLPELPSSSILGEPVRRDTAAALALAALLFRRLYGNPIMLVLTADHWIQPRDAFVEALRSAARGAHENGRLYTFAIPPTRPETAYGYLELGSPLPAADGQRHHELLSFREKPDRETARKLVADGRHYWNSGMFCWSVAALLAELQVHLPDHLEHLSPAVEAYETPDWPRRLSEAMAPLRSVSIDYAVMEKAERRAAVVAGFEWSDVGGWAALRPFLPDDAGGNAFRGRVASRDARENLVFAEDPEELVALVGVDDLVVVRSGSRTLV